MKLIIDQSLDHEDVEITIKCRLIDADLEKLIAQTRLYGFSITGKKDGATYPLRPEDIYYFESIDDKTFAYCEEDVYECSLRLYELEQQFARANFVRISKSCILNIMKLSSSSIVFFLTFLRSQNAFSAASTVIGTLSGFLTGIYVPMGSLPEAVQWVIKAFPVSHAGMLIRSVMLERPLAISFAGAPAGMEAEFTRRMGVVYQFGGYTVENWLSIVILLGTTVLFFGLSLLNLSRKNK